MSREILMEAADYVSRVEHIGKDYVLSFYSPSEIFDKVRQYREEHEARMDSIRANW